MKNFRWPVAVLVFLLTLAVSAGVIIFRERQLQKEHLLNRLREFEAVEAVELRQSGGVYLVSMQLAYVPDLAAVYRKIDGEIAGVLGQTNYRLELRDRRDELLAEAYFVVHLALYEGERRGNFTEMSERIDSVMAGFGLPEHRLTVVAEPYLFSGPQRRKLSVRRYCQAQWNGRR